MLSIIILVKSVITFVFILNYKILLINGQVDEKRTGKVDWTREIVLTDEIDFTLKWFAGDDFTITMEMSGETNGYLGVGFSRTKSMERSDIVIGWVDSNGDAHLKDLHAMRNEHPTVDKENNYELLKGEEEGNRTTIRFRRQWSTCDPNEDDDLDIKENYTKIIWAYSDEKPFLKKDDFEAEYHSERRGVLPRVFLTRAVKYESYMQCKYGTRIKLPI